MRAAVFVRYLLLILSLPGLITPAAAFWSRTVPPERIYFFGDSTTDSGNACNANTLAIEELVPLGLENLSCALPGGTDAQWYHNRASNGPVWAEHLVQLLLKEKYPGLQSRELRFSAKAAIAATSDLSAEESLLDVVNNLQPARYGRYSRVTGGNYATSGLESTQLIYELLAYQKFHDQEKLNQIIALLDPDGDGEQDISDPAHLAGIAQFALDNLTVNPHALYVFWVGGNDIRRGRDIEQAVTSLSLAIEAIASKGARVLVATVRDAGRAYDRDPQQKQQDTARSLQFNFLLTAAVAAINAEPANTDVMLFNTYSLTERIFASPADFDLAQAEPPYLVACGISEDGDITNDLERAVTNAAGICAGDPDCMSRYVTEHLTTALSGCAQQLDPDHYLAFDHIHMTTAGHRQIASCAADLIAPSYRTSKPWARFGISSCSCLFATSPRLSYLGYWPAALQSLHNRYGQQMTQFFELWLQFNPITWRAAVESLMDSGEMPAQIAAP